MKFNYKIVITGSSGRFGSVLKEKYQSKKIFYPLKKELDIVSAKWPAAWIPCVRGATNKAISFIVIVNLGGKRSANKYERSKYSKFNSNRLSPTRFL